MNRKTYRACRKLSVVKSDSTQWAGTSGVDERGAHSTISSPSTSVLRRSSLGPPPKYGGRMMLIARSRSASSLNCSGVRPDRSDIAYSLYSLRNRVRLPVVVVLIACSRARNHSSIVRSASSTTSALHAHMCVCVCVCVAKTKRMASDRTHMLYLELSICISFYVRLVANLAARVCDVRCAMCDVRCAMCDVRCAMCDVRYTTYSRQPVADGPSFYTCEYTRVDSGVGIHACVVVLARVRSCVS
jgi:hypothetical protein